MNRKKKKWFEAEKNGSERKKMVWNEEKWFGTGKNELGRKKMNRNKIEWPSNRKILTQPDEGLFFWTLKDKINTFLVAALETQLEKYTDEILEFERKYGTSFYEFEKMWDEGKIENRHSHEIESDFMDWEMMEMEKKGLLTALSKLQAPKTAFHMMALSADYYRIGFSTLTSSWFLFHFLTFDIDCHMKPLENLWDIRFA